MLKWLYLMPLFLLIFLMQEPILCQNLSWKNYTTDHGLPGNEVYGQLQDSRGYMWFATNHGICRFNGYEFIQPVDTSKFKGTEAFLPTEDSEGNIWFTRLDGSIWKIENDTILEWKYNDLISHYLAEYRPILKLIIANNGDVWISLHNFGILKINPEGQIAEISPNEDSFLFATIDEEDMYVLTNTKSGEFRELRSRKILQWNTAYRILEKEVFVKEIPNSNGYLHMIQLPGNRVLFNFSQKFYLLENQRFAWEDKVKFVADKMILTREGKILIPSHKGKMHGLIFYESLEYLKKGIFKNLLPDHYVTRILEDIDGGYWATTHHAGVFYCKNPNLEIFNKNAGLSADDIVCMSDDGTKNLFLGTRPAGIIKFNTDDDSTITIPPPSEFKSEINVIFFDKLNRIIFADHELHRYDKDQWIPVGELKAESRIIRGFPAKSISYAPNSNQIWISSHAGFANFNLSTDKLELLGQNAAGVLKERTFSVSQDKNQEIWVTTTSGLRVWRNNQYEMPPFDHPLLQHQPRNILIAEDGNMLFSLSGNGILIKNVKDEWQHIALKDGLISNNITKFYLSKDGLIYASSNSGLSILSNQDGNWNIVNVTEKDGLPSNQVNDVVKLNDVLWIATNKGLVKLKNLPEIKAIPSPILEKLWVNNKSASIQNNVEFAYNENNITLRFYALHYRSDAKIPYRFRLLGADSIFTNSNVREVNFANLAAGKYVFQIQAQNEAGEWGEMTKWPFEINPAWWLTAWFWVSVGFLFLASLVFWYRDRLKKKQHEYEIAMQIKDLESAAMRAQMNPHFIFNSLSSIQHFISENDKEAAISYLAKFARLVRLALHGSMDGQHTLKEEVEMLENYLSLEQLRFKGKFDFIINVCNKVDPDEITIPPMLVQPFVENALLHGMKNKIEGGKIEISFELNGNLILATIKDNGPGIQEGGSRIDKGGHKSVGMTLTKHRLEILSENNTQKTYHIQNLTSDTGEVIGASVTLSIPVN